MTAFPCYDNIADTLWTFANGENLARDRKVFLKGNKLLCYSEKHTAFMTADFDTNEDQDGSGKGFRPQGGGFGARHQED